MTTTAQTLSGWYVGDTVSLTITFTDSASATVAATIGTKTATAPSGAVTTITVSGSGTTNDPYIGDFTANEHGRWRVKVQGTYGGRTRTQEVDVLIDK